MTSRTKKLFWFLFLVSALLALILLFTSITPEHLVRTLGARNGYFLIALVSLLGGFSAAGAPTFIALLITLTVGGLNPLLLALIAGVGLALGDLFMFYAGSKGRELLSATWDARMEKIRLRFTNTPLLHKSIPVFSYLYIGFLPLPNDVLLLSLASIKYPMKKMVWIIITGDITFTLAITTLAARSVGI